jgi:membrane protein DedA with SNARE-associated domain
MQKTTRSAFPAVLSSGITLGFFGVLGWMLYDSSVVNSPPLLIMLGSLGAAFGAVVNFWLGSTAGSAQKTQLLAQAGAAKP